MAIQSFANPQVATFFLTGKVPKRAGWAQCSDIAKRKLDMLHAAADLKDLSSPPGNRLEPLKGNWAGFWSIRINQQWRIVFQWNGAPYQVDIVDYH